jgi:predicted DNA-binding transcriptional regulator YafY
VPATPQHQAKLLYLTKILLEKTDESHPMTVSELSADLAAYGVKAERKTIYADMELLALFGLDIEKMRGRQVRYYIASRHFELPELKLLVDAVQSSRFITEKKSNELIAKLSGQTSAAQAIELKRQVHVAGRAKSFNEAAYYSVDAIHAAINGGQRITFRYFDYDARRSRVFRRDGRRYDVTPVALCWDSDRYYLVAYSAEHGELRHYRVDRMCEVTASPEVADNFDRDSFDIAGHIKRVFGMYSGELVRATLLFDESLINNVLDHFGADVSMTPQEGGRVEVSADVSVSPVFLGWMFQFGERAQIKEPDSLVAAMRELIKTNARQYIG